VRGLKPLEDASKRDVAKAAKCSSRFKGSRREYLLLLHVTMLLMALFFCLIQLVFVLPMLLSIIKRYHFYTNNYLVVISLVSLFGCLLGLNSYFLHYSLKGIIRYKK